ncbi:MAG TPA: hypothetical protein VF017_11520 [Thermoanaerobaculia bacterium]|nr:hypothetical protein [Thermoanaerobaculia bacterium]
MMHSIPAPLRRGALALLVATLALAAPAAAARSRHDDGERLRFTGFVTDREGQPLAQVTVALEIARDTFDVLSFRRTKKDLLRLTTVTNEQGEYSFEWTWNGYYNSFELAAGMVVKKPDGDRLRVLERLDVSQKARRGNPVVAAIVIADADFVRNLQAFLASIASEDQRRVHGEAGEPDKVERLEHPDHVEVAWWYFELGKVYRFRDGRLVEVEPFKPVKEL